jgi:inner membrane protein
MADSNIVQRSIELARQSVTLKLFVIGFLILILLIPTAMVQSLIRERQLRSSEAVMEISSKWGAKQTITGPILSIPYRKYFTQKDGTRHYETRYAHFLPKTISVEGRLTPTIRYRGIYKAVLYGARIDLSGRFTRPDFANLDIDEKNVQWNRATIALGISDMTGIREAITLDLKSTRLAVNPGVENHDVVDSGVSVRLPRGLARTATVPFALKLDLNGSDQIQFVPVGEITRVKLVSTWKSPSFNGAFLPANRKIGKKGFDASWKVLHLNRNYPQAWTGSGERIADSAFGVRLFVAADVYQQATRTAKYAVLFIVLTFTIFFFGEIAGRRRLHPIQYLLVGFAIVIFYSLLIALSEHMRFGFAYLIGSAAVIGLVTAYARAALDSVRLTAMVGGILVILYGYLYMVLQMEDYALLMGSIGLFTALAIVMYITRRIDWYGVTRSGDET